MANKTLVTAEPGKMELFITREFDAPRELLFRAHTESDLYGQWVGPHGMSMEIEKMDARDGGSYVFTHERDGQKYKFHGVYHEVLAPERIIGTFEFDGLPETGHVILGTTKFEDLGGGRSRLVHQSVFQSAADRDGMIQSGMEGGVADGYEKLDELMASMNNQSAASA
jgi:uncharacterized protein YndB with AHSA1/START domain